MDFNYFVAVKFSNPWVNLKSIIIINFLSIATKIHTCIKIIKILHLWRKLYFLHAKTLFENFLNIKKWKHLKRYWKEIFYLARISEKKGAIQYSYMNVWMHLTNFIVMKKIYKKTFSLFNFANGFFLFHCTFFNSQ